LRQYLSTLFPCTCCNGIRKGTAVRGSTRGGLHVPRPANPTCRPKVASQLQPTGPRPADSLHPCIPLVCVRFKIGTVTTLACLHWWQIFDDMNCHLCCVPNHKA
jgi:hypothetical protein